MLPRRLHRILFQFLAIGENDERPLVALAFAECIVRRRNRLRKIRAAARNNVGIQLRQRVLGRRKIRCQRSLQKRRARKRYHANTVALQMREQVLRSELGAFQPARLEICRQHRSRSIHGDQNVAPHLTALVPREPPLRTRHRQNCQRQTEHRQRANDTPPPDAHASGETRLEPRSNEAVQRDTPTPLTIQIQRDEKWKNRQRPQPDWSRKSHHGIVLHIV